MTAEGGIALQLPERTRTNTGFWLSFMFVAVSVQVR